MNKFKKEAVQPPGRKTAIFFISFHTKTQFLPVQIEKKK